MNVISVVLFAVTNLFLNEVVGFQEIRVIVPTDNLNVGQNQHFVVSEAPLDIILENNEVDVTAYDLRCFKYESNRNASSSPPNLLTKQIYEYNEDTKKFFTRLYINAGEVPAGTITQWHCNMKNKGQDQFVQFEIKVKENRTEIRVNVPINISEVGDVKQFVVYKQQPLFIILENDEKNVYAYDVSCFKYKVWTPINIAETTHHFNITTKKYITKLHIAADKMTKDVSTKWQCNFKIRLENDNVTNLNVSFVIRVKGAETVQVKLGTQLLPFTMTNLSVLAYDGFYEHTFIEGEIIDLICSDINGGRLRLEYYDKQGTLFEKTSKALPLRFKRTMTSENNHSYVDCTVIREDEASEQEFTYKVLFTAKKYKWTDVIPMNVKTNNAFRVLLDAYGHQWFRSSLSDSQFTRFAAQQILNSQDLQLTRNEKPVAMIIGCVTAILMVIVGAIYVYCWYVKIKYTGSTERLNESFNQQSFVNPIPPFPNQWENLGNYDYAYVENEYNYILHDEVVLNNPFYHRNTQNGQNRITASEKDYTEIDESFIMQFNTRPVPYECHVINKNDATMSEHQYEILKKENITNNTNSRNMPKILSNMNYSNISKELSNTDVSKEPSNVSKFNKLSYENVSI